MEGNTGDVHGVGKRDLQFNTIFRTEGEVKSSIHKEVNVEIMRKESYRR